MNKTSLGGTLPYFLLVLGVPISVVIAIILYHVTNDIILGLLFAIPFWVFWVWLNFKKYPTSAAISTANGDE